MTQLADEEKIIQVTGKLLGRARAIFTGTDGKFESSGDYDRIVRLFGEVLLRVDTGSYQGDTRVILKRRGQYGFLNFGYGSCSGCDALQACSNFDQAERLINDLENGIVWHGTLQGVKDWLNEPDRKMSYYAYEEDWDAFMAKVMEMKE